jgi:hypothetical protein
VHLYTSILLGFPLLISGINNPPSAALSPKRKIDRTLLIAHNETLIVLYLFFACLVLPHVKTTRRQEVNDDPNLLAAWTIDATKKALIGACKHHAVG